MRFPLWWCPPGIRHPAGRRKEETEDRVALRLPGLDIAVERVSKLAVPAELTVVVPRAELRSRVNTPDGGQASLEVILNSITVVHSPRHPPEERGGRGR